MILSGVTAVFAFMIMSLFWMGVCCLKLGVAIVDYGGRICRGKETNAKDAKETPRCATVTFADLGAT
jgi:hypothetical protein